MGKRCLSSRFSVPRQSIVPPFTKALERTFPPPPLRLFTADPLNVFGGPRPLPIGPFPGVAVFHWIVVDVLDGCDVVPIVLNGPFHCVEPDLAAPRVFLAIPSMGRPPVQSSQFLEKSKKVMSEDKHVIVVREDDPGIESFAVVGDQQSQGISKAVHAFVAESDVRPVLVTGGSDQIDPMSTVVVARAVHRESRDLTSLPFQSPLFFGHFSPSIHGVQINSSSEEEKQEMWERCLSSCFSMPLPERRPA